MKKKLLYLACIITSFTFAQTITTFNSTDGATYAIVNGTIDQSPTGAGTSWSFTGLTTTENSVDTYAAPTATQITNFPGTTNVYKNTAGTTVNNILLKENGTEISLTGATTPDIELNYSNDNALIGTFPLSFGYNNSDPVAGTFTYQGTSGTFAGNIVKTVEAHGTLNMDVDAIGAFTGTVTQLKTVQTVSLSIPPIFNNIGTATQTTHNYYDNTSGDLVFRVTELNIISGFLGVNETDTIAESLAAYLLNVNENVITEFSVTPNPVQSVLNINLKSPTAIKSVSVFDINGRQVLSSSNITSVIDVSTLQAGMYIVQVYTNKGTLTKKFIKK
ncbi:T9SS type A sorting domain-containing protein [Lacinutrix cladophorae]